MKWTVFDVAILMLFWKKLDGAEWSWWWITVPVVAGIALRIIVESKRPWTENIENRWKKKP